MGINPDGPHAQQHCKFIEGVPLVRGACSPLRWGFEPGGELGEGSIKDVKFESGGGCLPGRGTAAQEIVVALEGINQGVGQGRNLIRILYWGRTHFLTHAAVVGKIQSCVGCWTELIRFFLGVGWKLLSVPCPGGLPIMVADFLKVYKVRGPSREGGVNHNFCNLIMEVPSRHL